jgi:hypothetical protein
MPRGRRLKLLLRQARRRPRADRAVAAAAEGGVVLGPARAESAQRFDRGRTNIGCIPALDNVAILF